MADEPNDQVTINEIVVDQTDPVIESKVSPDEIIASSEEAAAQKAGEKTQETPETPPEPPVEPAFDITQDPQYKQMTEELKQYKSLLEPIVSDQEKYNSFMGIITDNQQKVEPTVSEPQQPPTEPNYNDFSDVDDFQRAMAKYNRDVREYDKKEMLNTFKDEFASYREEQKQFYAQQQADRERQSAKDVISSKYELKEQDLTAFDQWLKQPKSPLEANELAVKLWLLENGKTGKLTEKTTIIPPPDPSSQDLPNAPVIGGGTKAGMTENEFFNERIGKIFDRQTLKI